MRAFSRNELLFLGLFFMSLVIGIWHALPLTNVVGEEWPYVGGVLRAIQSHSLVPSIDLSYVVSFYANFLLTLPILIILFPFFSFNAAALISALTTHFYLLYLIPRAVTVIAALVTAGTLLHLAKEEGHSEKTRISLVFIILSTILVVMIMHTGKMWALTGMFLILSVYFFARTIRSKSPNLSWWRSDLFWTIGFSTLGFINFPFAIIGLLVVPFLFFFYKTRAIRFRIFYFSLFWLGVFVLFALVNLHGILGQSEYLGLQGYSFLQNIFYYISNLIYLFPLITIILLFGLFRIKNKPLFLLISLETILNIMMLSHFAPWGPSGADFLRYSYLFALLLGCLIFTVEIRHKDIIFPILLVISAVFLVKTVYLLSVPMTYNVARDAVVYNFGSKDVLFINNITELSIPKNKESYLLNASFRCSSLCLAGREGKLNQNLKYLVLDDETDPSFVRSELSKGKNNIYVISNSPIDSASYKLIKKIGYGASGTYYEIGRNLGLYKLDYLRIQRLGTPVYIYKTSGTSPTLAPRFYPAS